MANYKILLLYCEIPRKNELRAGCFRKENCPETQDLHSPEVQTYTGIEKKNDQKSDSASESLSIADIQVRSG